MYEFPARLLGFEARGFSVPNLSVTSVNIHSFALVFPPFSFC